MAEFLNQDEINALLDVAENDIDEKLLDSAFGRSLEDIVKELSEVLQRKAELLVELKAYCE